MRLSFLKIDNIRENGGVKTIEIPVGGIQFEFKGHEIISVDPVSFQMTDDGNYKNIMKDIQFDVYKDFDIETTGEVKTYSLFSIVAHEGVQEGIMEWVSKCCKVVPLKRRTKESELFAMEYEYKYKKMLGE